MNSKSVRVQRVEKEIFHLMALFLQNEIPEPLEALISVTAVEVAPDMRRAGIYLRIVGNLEAFETAKAVLEEHRKSMQSKIARTLNMKFSPVLRLHCGHAREDGDLDRMLADLKNPFHRRDGDQ